MNMSIKEILENLRSSVPLDVAKGGEVLFTLDSEDREYFTKKYTTKFKEKLEEMRAYLDKFIGSRIEDSITEDIPSPPKTIKHTQKVLFKPMKDMPNSVYSTDENYVGIPTRKVERALEEDLPIILHVVEVNETRILHPDELTNSVGSTDLLTNYYWGPRK